MGKHSPSILLFSKKATLQKGGFFFSLAAPIGERLIHEIVDSLREIDIELRDATLLVCRE